MWLRVWGHPGTGEGKEERLGLEGQLCVIIPDAECSGSTEARVQTGAADSQEAQ